VGQKPRAFWGAYGASKAAFETLLGAYGEENRNIGRIKVAIVDPGATATKMRERAYPGEDPATLKSPNVVANRIVALLTGGFEPQHREAVNLQN
jgi:NAD(P)-dependent dehydrogenase (short-subunit alcohol dehydrogenase family)